MRNILREPPIARTANRKNRHYTIQATFDPRLAGTVDLILSGGYVLEPLEVFLADPATGR